MYDISTTETNIEQVRNAIKRRIFIETAVSVQIVHVAGLGGVAGCASSYGHFEVGWGREGSRCRVSIAVDENIQGLFPSYTERLVAEVKYHIRKYNMDRVAPENTASYMTDHLRGVYGGIITEPEPCNTNAYEGIENFLPAKVNKKLLLI